jgi:hypothetical protein
MERNYIRVGVLPVPPPHLVPPPAPNFFPISVLLEVMENGSVEKICWMQGGGKHLPKVRLGVIPGCKTENFFGCKNRLKISVLEGKYFPDTRIRNTSFKCESKHAFWM